MGTPIFLYPKSVYRCQKQLVSTPAVCRNFQQESYGNEKLWKTFWSYTPSKVKKNVVHLQKRHSNEEQCSTKQKHNMKSILFIKVLWTLISCNTKNSSFRQKQQWQIVNPVNQLQQGNALPQAFQCIILELI